MDSLQSRVELAGTQLREVRKMEAKGCLREACGVLSWRIQCN